MIQFLARKFSFIKIDPHQRDWLLWGTVSLLIAYGMITFFSVSLYISESRTGNPYFLSLKQFSLLWGGLIVFWLVSMIESQKWENNRLLLGISAVALLIAVLIIGDTIKGSKRWLHIGGFSLQVTEYIKLIFIVYLAGYINKFKDKINDQLFKVFFVFFLPTGIVCSLLILQPDLGTTAEIIFLTLGLTFIAGTHLLGLTALLIAAVTITGFTIQLSPHGLDRVLAYQNPWNDRYGSDYNIAHSLGAIGNGDVTGVGLGNGVHKLGYIPEVQNDFITSVLIEELGLIGFLVLLILFSIMLYRLYKLGTFALEQKQVFGSMVVFGVMLWIFFQLFLNIGGTINLTPIKGLVLPFFSSGGSFILFFSAALGLVFRIEKEVRLQNNLNLKTPSQTPKKQT